MDDRSVSGCRCARIGLFYGYSFLATVENVPVRLLPTVVKTVTAATDINAAIRPYSIAVAAVSSRHRAMMILNILAFYRSDQPILPEAGSQVIKPLCRLSAQTYHRSRRFGGYRGDVCCYRAARNHINPQLHGSGSFSGRSFLTRQC